MPPLIALPCWRCNNRRRHRHGRRSRGLTSARRCRHGRMHRRRSGYLSRNSWIRSCVRVSNSLIRRLRGLWHALQIRIGRRHLPRREIISHGRLSGLAHSRHAPTPGSRRRRFLSLHSGESCGRALFRQRSLWARRHCMWQGTAYRITTSNSWLNSLRLSA